MKDIRTRTQKKTRSGLAAAPALILPALIIMALAAGCGGGGGSAGGGLVPMSQGTGALRIAVAPPSDSAGRTAARIPAGATSFSVSVAGDDLSEPLEATVSDISGPETVTIANIPIGIKTITVNALDGENNILATREQMVTIEEGIFKDVAMTLGYTVTAGGITPSSIGFDGGDAVIIKNSTSGSVAVAIAGSSCDSLTLYSEGQLKCFLEATGTYTISAGSHSATATQETAVSDSLKAGISAGAAYGEAPLTTYLYADYISAEGADGDVTYQWNLDGGIIYQDGGQARSAGSLTGSTLAAQFAQAGEYEVTLTVTQDGQSAQDTLIVIVTPATDDEPDEEAQLAIDSVSPASIAEGAGGSIAITGTGFQSGAVVSIGMATVTATVDSATQITATVPATTAAGSYSITVANPDDQSDTLSNALTITAYVSQCPPSGTYYYAGIGGSAPYTFSEFGELEVSGTAVTGTLASGDSEGESDSEETFSGTLAQNSDGTYELTDSEGTNRVIVNNECSIMGITTFDSGVWHGGLLVRKGSAASYNGATLDGDWFLAALYDSKSQGFSEVEGGTGTLDGGSISGTMYTRDSDDEAEQTSTGDLNVSYTLNTTTGIIQLTTEDEISYTGGLSRDGNTIVLASTDSAEQGLIVMVKQPESFSYASDVQGEWRGVFMGIAGTSAMSGTEAWLITSSTSYVTVTYNNTSSGIGYLTYDTSASELESTFSAGDGTGLTSSGSRLFTGTGGSLMFRAGTTSSTSLNLTLYIKTGQSAPIGEPPTANAGSDQQVFTDEQVTLDGTASSDPDDDSLYYKWTLQSGPASVTLSDIYAAQPTFTPTTAGDYIFSLGVRDDTFTSSESDTVTITVTQQASTSCPPDGDYWYIGIGGSTQPQIYSDTGTASISELTMTANYYTGDSDGADNAETTNEQTTVSSGPSGVYTAGAVTVIPGNDCSFLAGASQETGNWDAFFMARKGTDYSSIDDSGTWHFTRIYYTSSMGAVLEAGTITTSAGSVTGTVYYNDPETTSEQTTTSSVTYTYNDSDGSVQIDADGITYSGGMSADGDVILAASSAAAEQGIFIITRQPTSFSAASLQGQWRGVIASKQNNPTGDSGVIELVWDQTSINRSSSVMNSLFGASTDTDTQSAANYESALSVNDDGSMLADWENTNWRDFFGNGHDFWIHAETYEDTKVYIEVLFKTDQSAPVTLE